MNGLPPSASSPRFDVHFGLLWALVSAAGFTAGSLALLIAAGIPIVLAARFWSPTVPPPAPVQTLYWGVLAATLFVPGAVIGTAQWLLLRRRVPRAGWWIPAAAAGLALALGSVVLLFVLESVLLERRSFDALLLYRLGGMGIGGALLGLALWLPLRRWVRRAWLAIPATVLAWPPFIALFLLGWECAEIPGMGCPEWARAFFCLGPFLGPLFFILVMSVVMAYLLAPGNRWVAGDIGHR